MRHTGIMGLTQCLTRGSCKYRVNPIIPVWRIKSVKPTWMSYCEYEWVMSHMRMSFTRVNDAMEGCLWCVTWLICTWLIYTWRIYAWVMSHNAIEGCLWYVTWLTSDVWHVSCIHESCHVMQSKGASDMCHDSSIHDSCIHESCPVMQSKGERCLRYVTWLICNMWHDSFAICDMTHVYMSHVT